MSRQQNRSGVIVVFAILMIFLVFGGLAAVVVGSPGAFGGVFFLFFIIVIIIAGIRASKSRPSVQRPLSQQTAFAPPPPPDTILVKCEYCGMSQPFSQKCVGCGAPLPRPGFN